MSTVEADEKNVIELGVTFTGNYLDDDYVDDAVGRTHTTGMILGDGLRWICYDFHSKRAAFAAADRAMKLRGTRSFRRLSTQVRDYEGNTIPRPRKKKKSTPRR